MTLPSSWWVAPDDFQVPVRIRMTRTEDEAPSAQSQVENATWIQKRQIHYLTYHTDGEEGPEGEAIWKLEPAKVTLIQKGWLNWTLRFEPGSTTVTVGYVGPSSMSIELNTHAIESEFSAAGGRVALSWEANFGGTTQRVSLVLAFERANLGQP